MLKNSAFQWFATATSKAMENGKPLTTVKEVPRIPYPGKDMLRDPLSVVDPEAYQIMHNVCCLIQSPENFKFFLFSYPSSVDASYFAMNQN